MVVLLSIFAQNVVGFCVVGIGPALPVDLMGTKPAYLSIRDLNHASDFLVL